MKRCFKNIRFGEDREGAVLILVIGVFLVFLAFAALAIDIGYVLVTRAELQNVADASALAAARNLGSIYENMSLSDQDGYDSSNDAASLLQTAQSTSESNSAAGTSIELLSTDVVFGQWDASTHSFTATSAEPDAVQVTTRRDGAINAPISTFFGNIFGINSASVSASSTAALTGLSTIEEGELIPVGLSRAWFDSTPQFCGQPIKFHPSNAAEGCAGWNVYDLIKNFNAAYIRKDILEPWYDGTFTAPSSEIGDVFAFGGGTLGDQQFDAFLNLFNKMKFLDGDGDDSAWSVTVVVYDNGEGCSNPNTSLPIVGYAKAKITNVLPPPDKIIEAIVICDYVEPGRGGGGEYGVKGSIPGLVQ